MNPKVLETEAEIGKWNCIKLKNLFTAKEITNRVKRQPTQLEEILTNYSSDTRLKSIIQKYLKKVNSQLSNNLIKKDKLYK
jgi:nitrogenase subunit NifH